MISFEDLYFEWLLSLIDQDGVEEEVRHVCDLLHNCQFLRRVGNDINRAIDGADLRKEFLNQYADVDFDPERVEDLMMRECTWLEMMIALARHLDYVYEGSVKGRLIELMHNIKLDQLLEPSLRTSRTIRESDQHLVNNITSAINQNKITANGLGGLFPLRKRGHQNQREVEIWTQQGAYFRERLEGVLWTSTK